jgi:pimeloyl-ACP methyl ester carboxylesterase
VATRDRAERLDANLADIDWSVLPAGSVRSRLQAPSGSLSMVSLGDARSPRVLLVPGVTGSKEDFTLMLPELATAGYYVQSSDLAGQYESAGAGPGNLVPPRRRYDYELYVGDLIAVLEAGAHPAHVLGYSFAGIVAQLALRRRPELFASLSLLSTPPLPGQSLRGVARVGWLSGPAPARLGAALMIWGIKRNIVEVPPGRLRFVRHRFGLTKRRSVRDVVAMMKHAPDLRRVLAASPVPKLVAVGEHDLWPRRLHARFADEIGATLVVYPSGHSPCETAPHQLSRDLAALFADSDCAAERRDGS